MSEKPLPIAGRKQARARLGPPGIHLFRVIIALFCAAVLVSVPAFQLRAAPQQIPLNFRNRTVLIPPHTHLAVPLSAVSMRDTEPVPIPSGLDIPPLIHIFAPGPTDMGFQGIDVEPNAITNFRGFIAQGYPLGTATGSDGANYTLFPDMRVFQGEYVAADGSHHQGTFAFI